MKTKIINGYEIETKLHKDMNMFSEVKIPKGWELITLEDLMNIWNNHRKDFDFGAENRFDEIVKQPLKDKEESYPFINLWLDGDSNGLYLDGYLWGDLRGSRAFGVRFKRKVKEEIK